MRIDFEEKNHTYKVNGNIADISVTELLKKHGLAPNYDFSNEDIKKKSAEKGKEVHKDLENVLNKPNYEPQTRQGRQFKEWVAENLDSGVGEQMLGYEYNGFILAGTADVIGITKDNELMVADHKNTSAFHREYVTWQVNLLDYMARQLGKDKVNGRQLNWKGAKKFYCFHYNPQNGQMKVIELEKIPDTEIERLILCEYNKEIYKRRELVIEPKLELKWKKAEQTLLAIEEKHKKAEEKAKALREELLKLFEQQGISKWTTDTMSVSYVPESESLRVDTDKLKKEYPQVFSNCQKLSKKKAYIRITLREEGE